MAPFSTSLVPQMLSPVMSRMVNCDALSYSRPWWLPTEARAPGIWTADIHKYSAAPAEVSISVEWLPIEQNS